mgnify:CR=1 FL=1
MENTISGGGQGVAAPAARQLLLNESLQHRQGALGLRAHAAGVATKPWTPVCKSCSPAWVSGPAGGRGR